MKKTITLTFACLLSLSLLKAQTFHDDFESYTVGSKLGPQSPAWTVWSGAAGENGTTDPAVDNTDNHTTGGSKSIYYSSTLANGGPVDCVLPFGGAILNTGQFTFTAWFNIPANKTAYFNFQGGLPPYTSGAIYTLDCFMNADGSMVIQNTGTPVITTTHPVGSWFELKINANLNTNSWDLVINGTTMGTWTNAINQVGGIDIYPADANASFWVDDVSYNIVPYTLPTLNAAVINVGVSNGLVSQSRTSSVVVRNLGTTTITSFNLAISQNGTPSSQTITGISLASLATYTVTASNSTILIPGTNTFTATVSNVNGGSADADPSDNSKTFILTPTQPATGKLVVAEEATGTWCQWCPRGAVYMDMMHNKYDGFFAGIAVHNNDIMMDTAYDAAFAPFVTGYPMLAVDRVAGIDPSGVETPFLQRIQVAPKAFVVNSETYNVSTRVLNATVTTTFQQAVTGNYRLACVLTEDDVTGTGAPYNQNNAYAGGASGVMGGFELLPSVVPASTMHYNHVARVIDPSFSGIPNAFGSSTTVGQVFTNTFTYTLPSGWDAGQINIIALFIDPTGLIDNAASVKISEVQGINQSVNNFKVNLFPNPTADNATVLLNLSKESSVSVALYSVDGALVARKEYGKLSGDRLLPIEMATLNSGMYFVNVIIDGQTSTLKLVKQ